MKIAAVFFLSLLLVSGCSYTLTSSQGAKVSSDKLEQIRVGRTTEMDLLKIIGPASQKERLISGTERLFYESTQVLSLTFPGGYQAKGLLDKEVDEIFEVTLRNGVVESYRFVKQ